MYAFALCLFLALITGEKLTEPLSSTTYAPLEKSCRFFIVRHGETAWNVLGKSQGWNDIPLNEEGMKQAEELGKHLSTLPLTLILASPLSRATQTAEKIAEHHPLAHVIHDSSLRFYDPVIKKLKSKEEINQEITEGATLYLKKLASAHLNENVVIITHGKVIKNLVRSFHSEPIACKIGNAQVVRILSDGHTLKLEP